MSLYYCLKTAFITVVDAVFNRKCKGSLPLPGSAECNDCLHKCHSTTVRKAVFETDFQSLIRFELIQV